jgi:hypothetical protein
MQNYLHAWDIHNIIILIHNCLIIIQKLNQCELFSCYLKSYKFILVLNVLKHHYILLSSKVFLHHIKTYLQSYHQYSFVDHESWQYDPNTTIITKVILHLHINTASPINPSQLSKLSFCYSKNPFFILFKVNAIFNNFKQRNLIKPIQREHFK